jgi:hypothetical protein
MYSIVALPVWSVVGFIVKRRVYLSGVLLRGRNGSNYQTILSVGTVKLGKEILICGRK